MSISQDQHNIEIGENLKRWQAKPLLQKIYREFYQGIVPFLRKDLDGKIIELGSGIGNLKSVVPDCICTDLFDNPWIDQVENAYKLTFPSHTVSNIVLFDVFHHLEYPGTVLAELRRVLVPGGRIIIFEPAVSLLGRLVYGLFHHEPLGLRKKIQWQVPTDFSVADASYYAAQGNASRIFFSREYDGYLGKDWEIIHKKKLAAISYLASGGYSKPQLYPDKCLGVMKFFDKVCGIFPSIFATRLLVVLQSFSQERLK